MKTEDFTTTPQCSDYFKLCKVTTTTTITITITTSTTTTTTTTSTTTTKKLMIEVSTIAKAKDKRLEQKASRARTQRKINREGTHID